MPDCWSAPLDSLMRNAISDRHLIPFCLASNGKMEQFVDRGEFAPGFENIPHQLSSPGVDTGAPFLTIVQFGLNSRSSWSTRVGCGG
jgi:hypothetical protein